MNLLSLSSPMLDVDTESPSTVLVPTYHTVQHHILEDCNCIAQH
jgi:hypothetical protein